MEISINNQAPLFGVKFSGKFTFADNKEIRGMLANLQKDSHKTMEIDLSEVDFVDSAALGMFLLIKEEAEQKDISLIIKNPVKQVKKMFELSRFYDLFKIQ